MLGITRNIGDIIAEIKMSMAAFSGCFVLVEGSSDSKFFRPRITGACDIVICCSKSMVIQAARKIGNEQLASALGIVDDDFDAPLNINHSCPDLIHTDTHDIETMLLASPALDKLLHEYADPIKLRSLEETEHTDFRTSVITRALPFGQLRLINELKKLNISFERAMSPWKYIDKSTWKLDKERLFSEFSAATGYPLEDIHSIVKSLSHIPSWNMIQGHDAVAIVSIAMRRVLGCRNQVSEASICSALRLAFDQPCFEKTALYASAKQWETIRRTSVFV